jgi:hypothetical protein
MLHTLYYFKPHFAGREGQPNTASASTQHIRAPIGLITTYSTYPIAHMVWRNAEPTVRFSEERRCIWQMVVTVLR